MSKSVGKKCNIKITAGNRVFSRAAVAQPGDDISWTSLLSFEPYDRETIHLFDQIQLKKDLAEEDVYYMPLRMEDSHYYQAVVVSQITVIEAEEVVPHIEPSGPEPHSEEVMVDIEQAEVGIDRREDV